MGVQNFKKINRDPDPPLERMLMHNWNPTPGPRPLTKNPMSMAHLCMSLNSNQLPILQFIHFIHKHQIVTLAGQWASSLAHIKLHLRCDETWIVVAFQRHTNWLTKRNGATLYKKRTLSVFSYRNPGGSWKRLNLNSKAIITGIRLFRWILRGRTDSRD